MKGKDISGCFIISTIVKLGVKSLGCRRNGICEVRLAKVEDSEMFPLANNKIYAYWKVSFDEVLGIYFVFDSMEQSLIEKYFYNNIFTVEEDAVFQLTQNNLTVVLKVSQGVYKVNVLERYYYVGFNSHISKETEFEKGLLQTKYQVASMM
ncbi:MAG: hypothetical protein AAFO82_14305 [Bacteroidota bacterium]